MRGIRLLYLLFLSLPLAFVLGCGGGISTPTPKGGFTAANVNGPYAFSLSGTDGGGFFSIVGSFVADGAGHITSGNVDKNGASGTITNASLTGNYSVHADGRGTISLATSSGNLSFAFVIVSSTHLLITRFETVATASGSADAQTSSAFSASALAGTMVFDLAGIDAVSTQNNFATVGSFTTDASGAVTSGVQDTTTTLGTPLNISTGSLTVGGTGRGTATVGSLNFVFYVVDANHLKIVANTGSSLLGGEAFRQTGPITNASFSGPFAFTVAGTDTSRFPLAFGGTITSNGSGGLTAGTQDFNDAGNLNIGVAMTSGSYSLPGGRGTLTITNSLSTFNFAIYPTTNGVHMIEFDSGLAISGAAFAQTGAFSNSSIQGNYGMNFSAAIGSGGELDAIASLQADGASPQGHYSGIIDANNAGSLSFGTGLNGTYTIGTNGRGPFTLSSGLGPQNMVIYVLNPSRALFLELDNNIVAAGDMEHQ